MVGSFVQSVEVVANCFLFIGEAFDVGDHEFGSEKRGDRTPDDPIPCLVEDEGNSFDEDDDVDEFGHDHFGIFSWPRQLREGKGGESD